MSAYDPYLNLLGIPPGSRPPSHWDILGVDPHETDLKKIEEAALKRREFLRQFAISPHEEVAGHSSRLLIEVAEAMVAIRGLLRRNESPALPPPLPPAVPAHGEGGQPQTILLSEFLEAKTPPPSPVPPPLPQTGAIAPPTGQVGRSQATTSQPSVNQIRPWVRFWARWLDNSCAGCALSIPLIILWPGVDILLASLLGMAALFVWCLIEPIVVSTWGTTPGKALLCIDVRTRSGTLLSYGQAMRRSVRVWFYGWGTGLGVGALSVSLVTLPMEYYYLTRKKTTTWDRLGDYCVSHRRIGWVRGTVAIVLITGLFGLPVAVYLMAAKAAQSKSGPANHGAADAVRSTLDRAWTHLKAGDYDQAIADYTVAIWLDPKNAVAYSMRGFAYLSKRQCDSAIADYTQAIRIDPKDALAYAERALAYAEKGDDDSAIADYTEAIRLDPKHAAEYYNRGSAHRRKGDYDSAIADFTEAIRLDPKHAAAYFYRGLAYQGNGDFDRAIADYTEAIRLDPKHAATYSYRGMAYVIKREYDRAIADCTEAIRLDPTDALALCWRGNAYHDKDDYERAIADYTEAIRLEPKDAFAYYSRGLAYQAKGQRAAAERDFAQAKKLGYKP